jgi:hypothetical protein
MEVVAFDLVFREHEVTLRDDKGEHVAVIREMSGRDHEAYLEALRHHVDVSNLGTGVNTQFKSIGGLTSLLLLYCMFWKTESGVVALTESELLNFPSRVLSKLTEVANKLNGFVSDAEADAVKN